MAVTLRRQPLLITFWHWSGVSPYTSSCEFAGTCVFDKQSPGIFYCGPDLHRGSPYCELTDVVLPSSFTRNHPFALGYSPCLPVSVYGTETILLILEAFLGRLLILVALAEAKTSYSSLVLSSGFSSKTTSRHKCKSNNAQKLQIFVPPSKKIVGTEY